MQILIFDNVIVCKVGMNIHTVTDLVNNHVVLNAVPTRPESRLKDVPMGRTHKYTTTRIAY